ncbi:hypothetical protein PtA15_4A631 [Puccinia triticina]|uniref:NUC153 domain-containing protein n=1 Tax=Puccinia triticina TaxID=208348 RepID=A0ABY7CG27_9BASI|nr:uncharacterized protein PtA15_4A631 [Puccinia triticina]WAQ84179.1 hypothetical protein PtA15_4A631 [Puccinia triticina]
MNDARFSTLQNDPRFIKPAKKNRQTTTTQPDSRFTAAPKAAETPTLVDYARGRQDVELGGPRQDQDIDLTEHPAEEEQEEEEQQIAPTRRIAAVNMDWDNLNALDLYKVFASLLAGPDEPGRVERVRVYKSAFGKARMAREDELGPPREIFAPPQTNDDDGEEGVVDEDRGAEFDDRALRQYQLDRLRYFYAVVELDQPATAQHLFRQIDGTEFERTANLFDLSYVPEDMAFEEADLWDECSADAADYTPVDFSTDVLRHSKVKLTWDSEDPLRTKYTRLNTQKLAQEELDQLDFARFIAPPSSADEEEEDEERPPQGRRQLRAVLGLDARPAATLDQHQELEISFKPGFVDRPPSPDSSSPDSSSADEASADEASAEEAAAEEAVRADELALLGLPDLSAQGDERHFDLAHIRKQEKAAAAKGRQRKRTPGGQAEQDRFVVDTDDRRFVDAIAHDPEFAIDPSTPQFPKTNSMAHLLHAVRAKRARLPAATPAAIHGDASSSRPTQEPQARSVDQLVAALKKDKHAKPSKRARTHK